MNERINQIKQELNFKAKIASKEAINEEDLSICFLALSEKPLIKMNSVFGDYYISVNTDNVDFQAKNLYLDHDLSFKNSIGVIDEVKKDSQGFKARVKFFANIQDSKEAFERYKAGLSDSVSVGFGESNIIEVGTIEGLSHFEIQSGVIRELSAVWNGADPKAKIAQFAKTIENQSHQIKKEVRMKEITQETHQGTQMQDNTYAQVAKDIMELSEIIKNKEAGLKAIAEGKSYKEFRESIFAEKIQENFNILPSSKKASADFSIANIVSGNIGVESDFKQPNDRFSIPSSFFTKFEDGIDVTTGLNVNKSSDTGVQSIEPTYYRGDKFIQNVKKISPILGMLDLMPDLIGEQQIPRDETEFTAYFVDEGQTTQGQKLAFSDIKLRPHTISLRVDITRTMQYMTPEALDSFILRKMLEAYKTFVEKNLFYGKSPAPINGLFNTDGVPVVADFMKNPSYKKALDFKAKLWSRDYDVNRCVFVTNSNSFVKLEGTPKFINETNITETERTLLESSSMAGFKVMVNNLIGEEDIIFADFSNVILGTWAKGLEVSYYKLPGGLFVVEGFYDFDIVLKRKDSIVISKKTITG